MNRNTPPIVAAVALMALAGCGIDYAAEPTAPVGSKASASAQIQLCHVVGARPQIIDVGAAAVTAHIAHGDYFTHLKVASVPAVTDGIHFRRIGHALAVARNSRLVRQEQSAGACRITIDVAAGTWRAVYGDSADPEIETLPLVVDVPDLTLRGAYLPIIDSDGRATDQGQTANVTTIAPEIGLTTVNQFSQPILVVNGRGDGFAAHRTVIEGFAFQSGNPPGGVAGGVAIVSLRVNELVVRHSRFEAGFSESVDLRAGSGRVEFNHLQGGGGTCDICLAGPGGFHAEGNRLLAGGIPGILVVPAILLPVPLGIEPYQLPSVSKMYAHLVNNEVRNHQRVPVGTGLRVGAIGVGAPNVIGMTHVDARNNLLVNNRFGMLVEAAFPVANTARRGDITLQLRGNKFLSSCQAPLLISLSRHTTALGLSNSPYLLSSSYIISLGGDLTWDQIWYSHPAGFANTLVVDDETMPNGQFHQYDAAKDCNA